MVLQTDSQILGSTHACQLMPARHLYSSFPLVFTCYIITAIGLETKASDLLAWPRIGCGRMQLLLEVDMHLLASSKVIFL